jgi:hypothetical protein
MLVEGHVRVPNSCLEVDLGRLEGVVGGKDEEELEFTALEKKSVSALIKTWKGVWPKEWHTA